MSQELTFAVPTLFGVEGLAADELRRLGLSRSGRRTDGCSARAAPWTCPGSI